VIVKTILSLLRFQSRWEIYSAFLSPSLCHNLIVKCLSVLPSNLNRVVWSIAMRGATVLPRLAASRRGDARLLPRLYLGSTPQGRQNGTCLLCQQRPLSHLPSTRLNSPLQRRGLETTKRTTSSAANPSGELLNDDNNAATPEEQILSQAEASTSEQLARNGSSPDITTYYTIFPSTLPAGPPPHSPFEIDTSSLRREFLKLQAIFHPDKFPQGPVKQRAEALSARINAAYRTLVDPLQRAQYLLAQWHGIDVLAEDGASKHPLEMETLMEVMQVQETIEELVAAPAAEAESVINGLREQNTARIEDSLKALSAAFNGNDIEAARAECVRLRFWYNLRDALRDWEPGTAEIRLVH
jgi:molecular chaperone HscB